MKIDKRAREEIRQVIEYQLQDVPSGERIVLDTELLEELLFERIDINKEKGLVAKFPVWSGEFLRKIDLSQINFDDVSFGGIFNLSTWVPGVVDEKVEQYIWEILDEHTENEKVIDYSYTNANINLLKLFEARFGILSLCSCNFEGLNFQNQNLSSIEFFDISYSNISNTGMNIPSQAKLSGTDSNFTNINLSNRTIDGNEYFMNYRSHLDGCCLLNTGINIKFDDQAYKEIMETHHLASKEEVMQKLNKVFNKDWCGCFVNGNRVKTVEERELIEKQRNEESDRIREQLISSIADNIQEQINNFKKM